MSINTAAKHASYLPDNLTHLENPQTDIPRIAKDSNLLKQIEAIIPHLPTRHDLYQKDARHLSFIPDETVHLIVTSPPYWNLKKYRECDRQLGHIQDYEKFIQELNKVWQHCYRILVPGGRLVCIVGDVCLSRRKNKGRHTVVPLHASIQEDCRKIGYDNLAPIIWYKITNVQHESQGNGAGFLGKPYEPNGVIKNDIEYILMERKHGGYRKPAVATRVLSVISDTNHKQWFQSIWSGITGASTKYHPAPYPQEIAQRLIRMFSFVGDTVLDPFMGTGTTIIAASKWGRNSIGIEVDPYYFELAEKQVYQATNTLFSQAQIQTFIS
jgi:DNA modification methylase